MLAPATPHLPAELLLSILWHITQPRFGAKRGIAACSLVCRYWAEMLRPLLFKELRLRSNADIAFLVEVMQCPLSRPGRPLGNCIMKLRFSSVEDWSMSSVNHLSRILKLCGRPFNSLLYLDIENRQASSSSRGTISQTYMPFSPFPRRPPTVPQFTSISLYNVQLQRQMDLVSLLDNCPSTRVFELQKVTFLEETKIWRRTLRSSSRLQCIQAVDCGDKSLGAQINLGAALVASQRRLRVDLDGDWAIALRVACALLQDVGADDSGWHPSFFVEHCGESGLLAHSDR